MFISLFLSFQINLLFDADFEMGRWWHCHSCRSNKPFSWTSDVGHSTSYCEKVEFWIVLLHPSLICGLCPVLGMPCWLFYIHHNCWFHISFHNWSLLKILPITSDCRCSLSQGPSMRHYGVGPFKTSK